MIDKQVKAAGFRLRKIAWHPLVWMLTAQIFLVVANRATANDSPSAMALLRGVEAARTKHDSLKVGLEIRFISPPPTRVGKALIEMNGDRLRCELFTREVADEVIIRNGDEFHGFRRVKHADIEIYDTSRATGGRGIVAFDPRVLGLSATLPCDIAVKDCLWYDAASLTVVGRESLHGVSVWRVKAARKDATADYWIEEPSFRVYRKTIEIPSAMRIEINSEFDPEDPHSPFPRRVVARRTYKRRGLSKRETEWIVTSFEDGAKVQPERFTLKSMDIPINTAVVDYRIMRRIGYWDGKAISVNPVPVAVKGQPIRSSPSESKGRHRLWLIVINVLFLVGIGIAIWIRLRHNRSRPE